MEERSGPTARRPQMPGYGIEPESVGGLLPWSWAAQRLLRAHNYWLATTTPGGAPHLAAVWGVWVDDTFWFSTGARSRKARNLAADPRCSVAPELASESIVVSGIAVRISDPTALATADTAYARKYGSPLPDPGSDPVFRVEPEVVIAVIERTPEFTSRATRWTFERG